MTAILCFMIIIGAVISAVFFQGSVLFCAGAAVIAAALLVIKLFLFGDAAWKKPVIPLLSLILLFACIYIPMRPTDYGYYDKTKMFTEFADAMLSGKTDKAQEAQSKFEEKYGVDDEERYLLAGDAVGRGNISTANEILSQFDDKTSILYYLVKEEVIYKQYASAEELTSNLSDMFIEAADNNPDWSYASKNAGCCLFDKKEYERASYYLTNAMLYESAPDAELEFYLGASLIEQGFPEKGLPLLKRSLDLGADTELQAHIAYYFQQLNKEVSGNEGE